jgi:hypothetical protein
MIGFVHLPFLQNQRRHVLFTTDPAGLGAVKSSRYNLGIYTRSADVALVKAVAILMQSSFDGVDRVMCRQKDWVGTVSMLLDSVSVPDKTLLLPLVTDIAGCCERFVGITGAHTVRLFLKLIHDDACRKFHIDGYQYRLLCTYHGPGTQWVYNDNVNRKYLGEGENDEIIKDWSAIQQINTFDVAILKGELPHARNGKGIVHRSPPIEQYTERRLVLRIDHTS